MRTRALLFAIVAALAMAVLPPAPTDAATPVTVKFRVFDEAGKQLTYSAVVKRMTNGSGSAYLSAGTFDLTTLQALTLNDEYNAGGLWAMPFTDLSASKQGLMVHWNTANTGYSTFLLDNGGNGFTTSETVNFNQRLALDARRQLQDSLARRPDYVPSAAFVALRGRIDSCFATLQAATTEAAKGVAGQTCTDLLAQAMTALLREHGSQRAAVLGASAVWGVTINPEPSRAVARDTAKIDAVRDLFAPQHRWARLVMDGTANDSYPRINAILDRAASQGVRTMGQLFDSTAQAEVPLATFQARVDAALAYPGFDRFSAWEVGNEVNGGWLGTEMTQKIEYAATRVRAVAPTKPVCLTFYWYSMEDTLESSLFNWIASHVTPTIRDSIDCVALSVYIDQQPLGFTWDLVFTRLAALFPGKAVMVGEMGFKDPTQKMVFKEGAASLTIAQGTAEYVRNRYPAAFATDNAVGGGFWWYFDSEMVGKKPAWKALRTTYCGIYPTAC